MQKISLIGMVLFLLAKVQDEAKADARILVAGAQKNLTAGQITDCERQADAWLLANPPPAFR